MTGYDDDGAPIGHYSKTVALVQLTGLLCGIALIVFAIF
jgi:hypothetical protein